MIVRLSPGCTVYVTLVTGGCGVPVVGVCGPVVGVPVVGAVGLMVTVGGLVLGAVTVAVAVTVGTGAAVRLPEEGSNFMLAMMMIALITINPNKIIVAL